MKKITNKVFKIAIAFSMFFTLLDAKTISAISPNEAVFARLAELDEAKKEQKIIVSTLGNEVKFVELYNHEKELLAKQENNNSEISLFTKYNDEYTVVLKADDEAVIEEMQLLVNVFDDMTLKQQEPYLFTIEAKNPNAKTAVIYNDKELKIASMDLLNSSNIYEATKSGTYYVELLDDNDHILGNGKTSINIQGESAKDVNNIIDKRGSEIRSAQDLIDLKNGGEYYLSQEIDLAKMESQATHLGDKDNIIIHGNGYSITNLQAPLFNKLSNSIIEDTYLQGNVQISDLRFGGSVANEIKKTTLTSVGVNVAIETQQVEYVGGLVGLSDNSEIKFSFASGYVHGEKSVGGLIGQNNGRLDNSYSSTGLESDELVGGVVAHNLASVENCYFSGSVKATLSDFLIGIEEGNSINNYASERQSVDLLSLETTLQGFWERTGGSYPQLDQKITNVQKEVARSINAMSVSALIKVDKDKALIDQSNNENIISVNGTVSEANVVSLSSVVQSVEVKNNIMQRSYFMSSEGAASPRIDAIIKGAPSTDISTTVTLMAKSSSYYIAVQNGTAQPKLPESFDEARLAGWFLKSGGDGLFTISKLAWNTGYDIYEANTSVSLIGTVTTNKGLLNGRVVFSEAPFTDKEISASISNGNDLKGTWSYEIADSIQSSSWTVVGNESTFTPAISHRQKYLRATFTANADANHSGSIKSVVSSNTLIKTKLESVTISGVYMNGETLSAQTAPNASESVLSYAWYHEGNDKALGRKSTYVLGERDINKKVYVKVTSTNNGGYSGEVESNHSDLIETKAYNQPIQTLVVSNILETSMSIQLSNTGNKGIFEITYKKEGDSEFSENAYKLINDGVITIVGLEPATTYLFRVRQLSSSGFLDSPYSQMLTGFTTSMPSVQGDLGFSDGNSVGTVLKADTSSVIGNGDLHWYRQHADGTSVSIPNLNISEYTITKDDIGSKIRVEYVGKENCIGTLVAYSDVIVKLAQNPPTDDLKLTVSSIKDTSVEITLPSVPSKKFQIGYGTSEQSPLVIDSKIYEAGSTFTLAELTRKSNYYVWLKYAADENYFDSEWNEKSVNFETTPSTVTGEIGFNVATPHLEEKLIANISGNTGQQGTWKWYKKSTMEASYSEINNFYPVDGDDYSSYYIPTSDELGTYYKVEYTGKNGFEGTKSFETKNGLALALGTITYDPPLADNIEVIAKDVSFQVAIKEGVAGTYRFKYGTKADGSDARELNKNYQAGGVLSIDRMLDDTLVDRNSSYYVWAKRVSDKSLTIDSDYMSTAIIVKTKKTKIMGLLSLSTGFNNPRASENIVTTYDRGQYIPKGNDLEGSWKWYRIKGDVETIISSGITNEIDEATGLAKSTYLIANADIGCKLKAIYSYDDLSDKNYIGTLNSLSQVVKGVLLANPNIPKLSSSTTSYTDKVVLDVKLNAYDDVFYQVLGEGAPMPSKPDFTSTALANKWIKATSDTFSISQTSDLKPISARQSYVVYVVRVADEKDSSEVIRSAAARSGTKTQSGTVALAETVSGQIKTHVSRQITATLNSANNLKGTWKWYYSNSNYSVSSPTGWTQITGGIYPLSNANNSTLSVPDSSKGKFLKAEFEPDDSSGFIGIISSGRSSKSVTKTYTEVITFNGKPYCNETVTLTMSGSDRTMMQATPGIQFKKGSDEGQVYTNYRNVTNTSMQFLIPPANGTTDGSTSGDNRLERYDDYDINVYVKAPDQNIYRNDDGSAIDLWQFHPTPYKFKWGTPISSAENLQSFIKGEGTYSNRSAKYVITSDISMASQAQITPPGATDNPNFKGILDGDFHVITGSKNSLFYSVGGTSAKWAEVKNIVFKNANVRYVTQSDYGTGAIAFQLCYYTKVNKIFAMNSTVTGFLNTGLIAGFAGQGEGYSSDSNEKVSLITISECAAAGSTISTDGVGASFGGFIGFAPEAKITDNFIYGMNLTFGSGSVGGAVGHGSRVGADYIQRNLVAAKFPNFLPNKFAHVLGKYNSVSIGNTKNNFYDKNYTAPGAVTSDDAVKGIGKTTLEFTSSGMQSLLSDAPANTWKFKNGYYPQLAWIEKDTKLNSPNTLNALNLYTATRASFQPTDSATTTSDIANGIINSAIQAPLELQANGSTFTSSNTSILQVNYSGTVVPVGVGTATISAIYKDPVIGDTIKNTFEFTSKKIQNYFGSSNVIGVSEPGNLQEVYLDGRHLTDESLANYQWFRQKDVPNAPLVKIEGANKLKYIATQEDLGYRLKVQFTKTGYATTYSSFSETIIPSPSAISTWKPVVTEISDEKLKISSTAAGYNSFEFAYSQGTSTANKVVLPTIGNNIVINSLSRNTTYFLYFRIPATSNTGASSWSAALEVKTLKTKIVGDITTNGSNRVGDTIIATIPDTNMQSGTWVWQRCYLNESGVMQFEDIAPTTVSTYTSTYTLQAIDYNKRIKIQYNAYDSSGSYEGAAGSYNENNILAAVQTVPTAEMSLVSSNDNSITASLGNDLDTSSDLSFDVGYVLGTDNDPINNITLIPDKKIKSGESITINNLLRNRRYLVFIRKAERSGYEQSSWKPVALSCSTLQTKVSGTVNVSGIASVDEKMIFDVSNINDQSGKWVLERRSADDNLIATLNGYSVDETSRQVTYTLTPEDAGYLIKASFTGTQDFTNTISGSSAIISKAKYKTPVIDSENVKSIEDYRASLIAPIEIGNYEYEYSTDASFTSKISTGSIKAAGKVEISGLSRNCPYFVRVKRLGGVGVIGYEDSEYSSVYSFSTDKTLLSGKVDISYDIVFSGGVPLGTTVTFQYVNGVYTPAVDDSTGVWKLYLDSEEISAAQISIVDGKASYNVKNSDTGKRVRGEFSADSSTDLKGSRSMTTDRIFKDKAKAPAIPLVLANEAIINQSSSVQVSNAIIGQYYKAVYASENAPIIPSEADMLVNANGWFIATEGTLEIDKLQPNKDYRVFTFVQESLDLYASELVPSSKVTTKKQQLASEIEWMSSKYLVGQENEVRITHGGVAPTGVWSWYVSKDKLTYSYVGNGASNISGEYHSNKAVMPMHYKGFYVKAVFVGNEGYYGRKEIVTPQVLGGSLIVGNASIDNETPMVFDAINASYSGSDEVNGSWTWFRGEEVIDSMLYNRYGTTSTFYPDIEDIGKTIKAKYSAGGDPFIGESTSEFSNEVKKGEQAKPDAPLVLELLGNQVHIDPPSNYFPEGNKPLVLYGYQEGAGEIIWESGSVKALSRAIGIDNNWIKNLKPNTTYNLYSKYIATNVYEESIMSEPSIITTDKIFLDGGQISVTYDKSGVDEMAVGTRMNVTFTGAGFEDGLWSVSNAHSIIYADREGTIDVAATTNAFSYQFDSTDMNSVITITYTPKNSQTTYTGIIVVQSSGMVCKQANSAVAATPLITIGEGLSLDLDVEFGQEYILSEESGAPSPENTNWEMFGTKIHTYTGLKPDTDYYVHGRIKESEFMNYSNSSVSNKVTTRLNYTAPEVVISNSLDPSKQAYGKLEFDIPQTWSNQVIGINNISMLDGSNNIANLTQDLAEFSPSNLAKRGSDWGNSNFAYSVDAVDGANVVVAHLGLGANEITIPDTAVKLVASIYRVNAVSNVDYTFSMDLREYDIVIPATGNIKMATTISTTSLTQIQMHADSGQITSERDTISELENSNLLPVRIDVCNNVVVGGSLSAPLGLLDKDLASIGPDELYLKMSKDGSGMESKSGIFFDALTDASYTHLDSIPSNGKFAIEMFGVYGENVLFEPSVVQQAYQIKFKYSVNKSDL